MSRPGLSFIAMLVLLTGLFSDAPALAQTDQRVVAELGGFSLSIGLVTDDVWVFELSSAAPDPAAPFAPSLMVDPALTFRLPQGGGDSWSSATAQVKLNRNPPSLTVIRTSGEESFTIRPYAPEGRLAGLSFIGDFTHLLGLGANFRQPSGVFNLLGENVMPGSPFGNSRLAVSNYRPNQVQIPVVYGLGQGRHSSALFVDETRPLMWSFKGRPWTAQVAGQQGPEDVLRFFVITGDDLPALRREFMTLTGRPPVPPLGALGVWASNLKGETESDWRDGILRLKSAVPGLAGVVTNGAAHYSALLELAKTSSLKIMLDESAYVSQDSPHYPEMARRSYLVRQNGPTGPIMVVNHQNSPAGLVDYTNPAAPTFWHSLFRQQQFTDGVTSFRLIDGELEDFSPSAWYEGAPGSRAHSHYAWANRYALKWLEGLAAGARSQWMRNRPRLLMMSRTGLAGLPRLGGSLYNGDASLFGSRSLTAVKAHVAMSGMDYYSADLSPALTGLALDANTRQMYEAWLAKTSLTDLPLVLPEEVLQQPDLRYNLALRESLRPYLYSLAWEAY
ncbi:MAG: hypothetical protein LBV79_08700, partial [Candidatus Adiutrix sp.]|nr:hypothetical protein [Candidatus Adiutrix sp.]